MSGSVVKSGVSPNRRPDDGNTTNPRPAVRIPAGRDAGERDQEGAARVPEGLRLHPAHVVLTDTVALGVIWLTTRGACFARLPGATLTEKHRLWILERMEELEREGA